MENEQVPLHHISSQRRRLTGSSSSIKPFCLMVSYEFPPYGFIRSFAQIIRYSRISAATDIYSLFQPRNFAAVWQSPFDINHFALMTNNSPSNKISIFSPSCLQSSKPASAILHLLCPISYTFRFRGRQFDGSKFSISAKLTSLINIVLSQGAGTKPTIMLLIHACLSAVSLPHGSGPGIPLGYSRHHCEGFRIESAITLGFLVVNGHGVAWHGMARHGVS